MGAPTARELVHAMLALCQRLKEFRAYRAHERLGYAGEVGEQLGLQGGFDCIHGRIATNRCLSRFTGKLERILLQCAKLEHR